MVQLINEPTTPVYLPSACGNEKTPTPTIEPITIAIRPGAESLTRLSMAAIALPRTRSDRAALVRLR
ncbi:hypothetical protein OKW41_003816 [Paraburkholderia sp. UCT70]